MKFSSTYLDWLKSEITEEDLGNGYTEITAPFLDRHNDYIQIYIQALKDGMYRISDDMYTITDLKMSGLDFKTPKRKQILQDIVRKRGIELDSKKDELFLTVPKSNLGEAQHQLFQAMLDINAVSYTHLMGADPHAVLMAIGVAASCAFGTPVGTPPNTLVLGPGQYKFTDYVKAGVPLILVCFVVSLIIIPMVWPFFPGK